MPNPISIIPAKRRVRRKRRVVAAPSVPQILSVTHRLDSNEILVTLSVPVVSILATDNAMAVRIDEESEWVLPTSRAEASPTSIVFVFPADVSETTQWAVPNPTTWQFADERELSEPYEGEIG